MARDRGPSPSLDFVPADPADASLSELVRASRRCTACPLYENATQTVFGEGPTDARVMLVGEQPGDQEDKQGHPFVGPAGRVLDQLLEEAGVPRDETYVTNAVKHFKWEPRGKRRIHAKPNMLEVHACRGWLDAELALVEPKVIVCLGAVAAQSFFGSAFRLTKERGKALPGAPWADHLVVTYHPSALLRRMSDAASYDQTRRELLADLALAWKLAGARPTRRRLAPTRRDRAER